MVKKSILLIADPHLQVPPLTYGGVERIVDMLGEGLAERGWNVTLVCHPESTCDVNLLGHRTDQADRFGRIRNAWNVLQHVRRSRYDLIHSFAHCDLTAALWPFQVKQIQSFQANPPLEGLPKRIRLIPKSNLWFTVCGNHMVRNFSPIAPTRAIHNGVRIEQFKYEPGANSSAPLVFLGRIERIKGTHHAIEIAKATDRKLVIAGNRSSSPEIDRYFSEEIEPHLSNTVTYIGPVDDAQKNVLLGQGAALLMPIEWDEPFGIVMSEALACGTPVIGFNRGALPEIVDHGLTGASCSSIEEMIEAVRQVDSFSRRACRQVVEDRFSASSVVNNYIALYEEILNENDSRSRL